MRRCTRRRCAGACDRRDADPHPPRPGPHGRPRRRRPETLVGAPNLASVVSLVEDVARAHLALYRRTGASAPWLGYLARDPRSARIVGTCAFKDVPRGGIVEIAYYTFPDSEGRGRRPRDGRRADRHRAGGAGVVSGPRPYGAGGEFLHPHPAPPWLRLHGGGRRSRGRPRVSRLAASHAVSPAALLTFAPVYAKPRATFKRQPVRPGAPP